STATGCVVLQRAIDDKPSRPERDIELDGRWDTWFSQRRVQFGVFPVIIGFAVEGEGDGIQDRGFPGPGGPVEQKEADLVEAFKAQLLFRRVWTDGLEGEFMDAHYFTSPSWTRLT